MKKNEKTHLGRALFIIGLSTFLIFLSLKLVIENYNQFYLQAFSRLNTFGEKTFAQLKDSHIITKGFQKHFLYTYRITDLEGEFFEVTEEVDEKTHRKLRVGDTVVCNKLVLNKFNKKIIVSKIQGNEFPNYDFEFMIQFSNLGILFSVILFAVSIFVILF
ncbi:MAG: hypothetical protein SFU98_21535 [Leptospiraceae bacterium]|nr:hypothetical protein [Leptospiraceae bacterium]